MTLLLQRQLVLKGRPLRMEREVGRVLRVGRIEEGLFLAGLMWLRHDDGLLGRFKRRPGPTQDLKSEIS